ncbi:Subunit of the glycosylphosphatidylinositol transamidase complex-like protein, partial [Massospora cicadina]
GTLPRHGRLGRFSLSTLTEPARGNFSVIRHSTRGTVLEPSISASTYQSDEIPHYGLLRRPLAQLVKTYGVAEMRLGFTRGQWDPARFGAAPHHAPAPGVELVAWIAANGTHGAAPRWRGLTHKLAGLFCATLANAASPKTYVSPQRTFSPSPAAAKLNITPFYAHLALESACTENLTPWLKQLPCRHYAGLASLVKPHGVFDSLYYSMALEVAPHCAVRAWSMADPQGSSDCQLKVTQRLTVVKQPPRASRWGLSKLLKGRLNHACPLAKTSEIVVKGPPSKACEPPPISLEPAPVGGWACDGSASYAVSSDLSNLTLGTSRLPPEVLFPEAVLRVERHMVDRVGLHGAFNISVTNLLDGALDVALLQVLPWYLQPLLHTLRLDGQLDEIRFQPARDQHLASALELEFRVPALTTRSLRIEFVAKFLTLDQYPPDPHRGFSLGPAVVTVRNPPNPASRRHYPTSNLLAFLPTPDFSMPYNVAAFASTAFALFLGGAVNSLLRQFNLVPKPPE